MSEAPKPVEPESPEEPELIGTLFVVMVLIIFTAGMWAAVYFMLLTR